MSKSDIELKVMTEEVSNAQTTLCCFGGLFIPVSCLMVITGVILLIIAYQNKPRPQGSQPPVYKGSQWNRPAVQEAMHGRIVRQDASAGKDYYGLGEKEFDDMKLVDDGAPSWIPDSAMAQSSSSTERGYQEEAKPKEVSPPPPI